MNALKFPDPNDRTPNDPLILVSPKEVIKIYLQYNKTATQTKVDELVKEWFVEKAKEHLWDRAEFTGHQCILGVNFQKKNI